jgi:SAM-dependent methyltransferase
MAGQAERMSLAEREARELATFTHAARQGRSSTPDEELVVPEESFARLLGASPGTPDALEQMFVWTRPLQGAKVLEICCHDGEFGVLLAVGGADVTAVDLCPDLIARAHRRAALNHVQDRMKACVMSAHALDLPDDHFDFVFGKASLHHLDLEASKREILRVLKPGGYGVFSEPITFSPALSALRRWIPVPVDKESPDERQLDARDVARFVDGFVETELAYFRLFSRLYRICPPLYRPLARADRALLDRLPALGRYAGVCVLRVRKAQ